ncbi:DRG2 [Cordylochernes scorpioides]|uniref:DRG2 n=1 Tax=Cordylochernes scorpioides TaxID=51811 RepID=A0ABY6JVV7_9ARAC|nr:DRG2 [Cordylochernes scorpioides]
MLQWPSILAKVQPHKRVQVTKRGSDTFSTLLNTITDTHSESASYEFTTLTCIPGVIQYKGANIQLLDLPGIIEGASQGKGRGRQVIAVARTADLVIIMLDATKGDIQRQLLEKELESVGIRLNRKRPNIYFKVDQSTHIPIIHSLYHLDNIA